MTDKLLIGVILAVIVECAHWTKFRWDFDEQATARAWQLTTVAIFLTGILIFLDGSPLVALPNLLTWQPLLLLPMQFVQSYGLKDSLPLNTFSFLAKQRRQRNLRLGLAESLVHINFGNLYFVIVLVASTLGSKANSWPFLPGIVMLTGWILLSSSKSRPLSLAVALLVAGGLAIAGQMGITEIYDRLGGSSSGSGGFNPNYVTTMIGKSGTVVLSPEIVWRLRTVENKAPPALLRVATYNTYRPGTWVCQPVSEIKFEDLDTGQRENVDYYILRRGLDKPAQIRAVRDNLRSFSLRGAAFAETPLPLPGDATAGGFELDGMQSNSFGCIRVFPKNSVIDGTVLWKGDMDPEIPPIPEADLEVPPLERAALRAVLKELHLETLRTLREKLSVISAWFLRDFRYTLDLTIQSSSQVATTPTALTQFLTTSRAGHCEYFASASTLLLREAGIPARYATGFAVIEHDMKHQEYLVRGTHGHAWSRVWDAGTKRWLDFDATPASWQAIAVPQQTLARGFNDSLKRLREDFFLWRNRPSNRLGASLVMSAIALGVIGFVVKRLWKSKRRLESARLVNGYTGTIARTPLNALEPQAEKRLGSRPPGQPFAAWLLGLRASLPNTNTLDEAIELHQRLRFDPAIPDVSEQDRLKELARQLESTLKRG